MAWPAQNEKPEEQLLPDSRLQAKHMLQSQPGTVGLLARDIEYALQIVAAELAKHDGEKVSESAETDQARERANVGEADPFTPTETDTANHQSKPRTNRKPRKTGWLAEAMMLVRDNPEWSDAKIAMEVEVNASTVSRSDVYQQAAHVSRSPRTPHKGHITTSEQGRDVEAYPDGTDPAYMDLD